MAKVEVYTTDRCPYCVVVKNMLDRKGVKYEEIHVPSSHEERQEMIKRANGRRTVPQIFIDDVGIGGDDEFMELHRNGKLDEMLGLKPVS